MSFVLVNDNAQFLVNANTTGTGNNLQLTALFSLDINKARVFPELQEAKEYRANNCISATIFNFTPLF